MRSVCIATFNGESYLSEQLASILPQLAPEDEVIVSDDGSTDQTVAVIKSFQAQDARIRLVKGPQQGLIKNFEHALSLAQGELIFLADQDDVWKAEKVAVITQYFVSHPSILAVVSDLVITDKNLKPIQSSYFEYRRAKEGMLHNIIRSHYIGAGMAFRKQLLKIALPLPDNIPMHDMWIGVSAGRRIKFIRQPLTLYRRHDLNASEIKTTSGLKQKIIWRQRLILSIIKRKLLHI